MTNQGQFTPAAVKPTVPLADFDKLDLRVGTIERVEDVPKSDKLIKLTVDFGDHSRQILVGMKRERPDPGSEILGRQALFLVNVTPKRLAGELSEGMLVDIGYADGLRPVLAVPEAPIANGARAG